MVWLRGSREHSIQAATRLDRRLWSTRSTAAPPTTTSERTTGSIGKLSDDELPAVSDDDEPTLFASASAPFADLVAD